MHGNQLVHTDKELWKPLEEPEVTGIWIKILRFDKSSARAPTFLLKFEPGATYPAHDHPGGEECFVLDGDIHFGADHLHQGDYLFTAPGNKHGVRSDGGCVVLFSVPQEVQKLKC
jgi:quercetin dioxygenase-like cupin family protein